MSGRDSYPIFERDAHGFPVRVRWVDRGSVPAAFVNAELRAFDRARDRGADSDTTADPATDPDAHGAT